MELLWNVNKTVETSEMPGATPIMWEYENFEPLNGVLS